MRKLVKPFLSIFLAFLIGAIIITCVGENPIEIYTIMFKGALGSKNALAGTLVKMTTLIFVGLSYGFAYKCGLINIGIEGQLYMGAMFTTLAGIYLDLPSIIHIPVCLLVGFLFGGIWGGIVGFLKVKFKANEMITTVMMNYIAIYLVGYFVNGPFKEKAGSFPQSDQILESAFLPTLIPRTQFTIGFFIALIAIVIYSIFWRYTTLGFKMNVVGESEKVAKYAGIKSSKMIILSMFISGGLGGLAGSMEVLGVQHKILEGLSSNYGFDGIAVSLLGNNSGLGILFSSFLFAALKYGGNTVQMFTKLPIAVVNILQALVILFVVIDIFKVKKGAKNGVN